MIIIVPVLDVPPFQGLISFFWVCSQGDALGFHRAPLQGLAISPNGAFAIAPGNALGILRVVPASSPNGAPCDSPGQRPGCLASQILKP